MEPWHVYSVLKTEEKESQDKNDIYNIVQLRNQWGGRSAITGGGNWEGHPWSDNKQTWDKHWFQSLDPKFKDDGTFLISFQHMLEHFLVVESTRIFDDSEWFTKQNVSQGSKASITYRTWFSYSVALERPSLVSTSAILDPGFYEVSMKIEAQYRTVSAKRRVYSTEDAIQLEMTERPAKVQEVARNLQ
ncbi:hypothetical protein LTR37_006172 [Vermiconidia calcicola]|uniref:Uncharacterized protein n=1 Tax=Vermiconidia calcicola TaxID=1690605 RepID=A0ACC3NHI7_9PEZI|nr:hypothetical protein LTR37_006172 [Vermiconidia calcicola]